MRDPSQDPRPVAELFEAALQTSDEEAAWNAVFALHHRRSEQVLDRAVALTTSGDPATRARGVNIISQSSIEHPISLHECFETALRLLTDEALPVQSAAIFALQNLDRENAAKHIIPFADHGDAGLRYRVAFALGGVDTSEARQVLLKLMHDTDAQVRNWATFGIGQLSDADDAQIREALARGLTDADPIVRYESVVGLGLRRDARANQALLTMLSDNAEDELALDAASMIGFKL